MADPAHPQLNALRARLGALVARERQWRLLAGYRDSYRDKVMAIALERDPALLIFARANAASTVSPRRPVRVDGPESTAPRYAAWSPPSPWRAAR